jgi:dTDP-glucose pyrophosphorylase
MAGEGSRFFKEGYTVPKPLIDIKGKPMIRHVVENLKIKGKYIFLIKKEHIEKYKDLVPTLLDVTNNNCKIIKVNETTKGAACTALLAKQLIDNEEDLLIANSDQLIDCSLENFCYLKNLTKVDGIVFCFYASHPKWSFVKLNQNNFVEVVAEKNPISNIATCGIYWYEKAVNL